MNKPIIAVDIDDVLAKSAQGFIEFSNKTWGHTLSRDDYDENWAKVWGVPVGVALERANFVHVSGVFRDFLHFAEAYLVLLELSKKYGLVVATSRRISIEKISNAWLVKHFPEIFEDVYFNGIYDDTNAPHEKNVARTKSELLLDINAGYIIDDQIKHCFAAADSGIEAVLFGDYSWNRCEKLPPRVTRCKDWAAVEEYFAKRS